MSASEHNLDADVDVAIIGAGPGGYAAAFRASDLGLSVALVDEETRPGGVCLFRGCIPSKALLHVAKAIEDARKASDMGVVFDEPSIDLETVRAFKSEVVDDLTAGLGQLAKSRNVRFIQGRAAIADPRTLEIETQGDKQKLHAGHIIVATGSRPARPRALSLASDRVLDSTAALDLPEVPSTLLVVGGGYIGLELGTVYAALGSVVTLVEMTDGLLPGVDRDLVKVLHKAIEPKLEAIHLGTRVARLTEEDSRVRVALEGEESTETSFDRVLVAVGRRPRSDVPGLDRTRAQIDDRGFIAVDRAGRTAEPSIFAIGDVTGEPMLAHRASLQGKVAAEAASGKRVAFEPRAIPAVVFTEPEIAWCGLTETEAARTKQEVGVGRFPWSASGRAMTLGKIPGLTKLVFDPVSERILGAGFVGTGAGELVSEAVLAIEMASTATDIELSIHPHPTLSETLVEAAEAFRGHPTHTVRRKTRG